MTDYVVSSGIVSSGLTLSTGDELTVSAGGTAEYTQISSGAAEYVAGRGSSLDDIIVSGGVLYASNNSVVSGLQVQQGGVVSASSNANLTGLEVYGSVLGGRLSGLTVDAGGMVLNAQVFSGDDYGLISGGQVYGIDLHPGAKLVNAYMDAYVEVSAGAAVSGGNLDYTMEVFSGGSASGVTMTLGRTGEGTELVYSGAVVRSSVLNMGYEDVSSGALSINTLVLDGADTVQYGGRDLSAVVSGGELTVSSGGRARATTVAGGEAVVSSGGVVTNIVVEAGGLVSGAGTLTGANIDAGSVAGLIVRSGSLEVLSGGYGSGLELSADASITIDAGGSVSDVRLPNADPINDDGSLALGVSPTVLRGALSGDGEVVDKGPRLIVFSGDASGFSGELVLSGGVVELANAAGLGNGEASFETLGSRATLKVEAADAPAAGDTFSTTLVDFDSSTKRLDLSDVPFTSGATVTLSGSQLSLVDGAYTATFILGGLGAQRYVVAADGSGGTVIHAVGAKTEPIVQAAAAFGAASTTASTMAAHDQRTSAFELAAGGAIAKHFVAG